jgi:hypothetical protein
MREYPVRILILLLLVGLALPMAVDRKAQAVTEEQAVQIVFSEIERELIRDYFGDFEYEGKGKKNKAGKGRGGLPPGLAKREQLPPGLQKQIVRNGTLPPGLATYDLPNDLLVELPPPGKGTRRVIVGNDVILIREGTRLILDVLKDVLTQ